jgi:DNA polymerase-3 subunit delta
MDRLLTTGFDERPGSTIVFYVPDLPNNKNRKKLAAAGAIYNFQPFRQRELYDWLQRRISANGKSASQKALTLLVERVGRDLRRLASELDKLVTYLGSERELDEKSVLIATSRTLQGDIFALIDTVISGRTAKALTQMQDLLSGGEPPLRILAMLVRQFRLLGESQELLGRGCPPGELAARLGIHPYAAEVLARQAQRTEQSWLGTCVDLLLQADLDIKRGRANQRLVLETLVIALGQAQKSA